MMAGRSRTWQLRPNAANTEKKKEPSNYLQKKERKKEKKQENQSQWRRCDDGAEVRVRERLTDATPLTNSCEKRGEKPRRKGKIEASECRVPKNSKER